MKEKIKRVSVRVQAGCRENSVAGEGDRLKVKVTAPPREGKANRALIKVLSEYYKVRNRDILILRGERSGQKLIGIREKE